MSSLFSELFSDYQDNIKSYTAELDVTELSFMRAYTRGMHIFQRKTELVQARVTIQRINGIFTLPDDYYRAIELRSVDPVCNNNDYLFLLQEFEQFRRNENIWEDNYLETPRDYVDKIPSKAYTDNGLISMATTYNRQILLYPDYDWTEVTLWYVPEIQPISRTSAQWTLWFPVDEVITVDPTSGNLIPATTRFLYMFQNSKLTPDLSLYERAFLDFAISEYIISKGSANYKVFENRFNEEVGYCIMNKPTLFREGSTDYFLAPYS